MVISIVCATEKEVQEFQGAAPLSSSIVQLQFDKEIASQIAYSVAAGPALHFNRAIDQGNPDDILLFTSQDVRLDDFFISQRVQKGLQVFDVIGVAGNTRITESQTSWDAVGEERFLSGIVSRGSRPFRSVQPLGPVPAACELLDGALVAARCATLRKSDVRFDPTMTGEFLWLDFCRSARAAGLKLGTWPIAITSKRRAPKEEQVFQGVAAMYFSKWSEQT